MKDDLKRNIMESYPHTDLDFSRKLPSINFWIDKIESGEQFNLVRAQHGWWNAFHKFEDIKKHYENEDYDKILTTQLKYKNLRLWGKDHKFNLQTQKSDQLKECLTLAFKLIHKRTEMVPTLKLGVSGSPAQKKILNYFYKKNVNDLYNGDMSRHYGRYGDWYHFFQKMNELKVKIILVGSTYLGHIKEIYEIEQFDHILIPYQGALKSIDNFCEKIIESCENYNKSVLVLNSTGYVFGSNMVVKIHERGISSFDVGRGLDFHFFQYKDKFKKLPSHFFNDGIQKQFRMVKKNYGKHI